jgi:hypothetical protein
MTGPHQLDGISDLTCEDGTLHDAMDGRWSTCNQVPTRERPLVSGPMIG